MSYKNRIFASISILKRIQNMKRERIENLLSAVKKGIYEKDSELALSLLAALSGESIILLGPPGVAKSMVARRLKLAFQSARSFEYLMSRFSTPDELFGPVSISQLKDADKYVRNTDGYLPSADVVFLDEIWKAGPAIQNTLLTVINEKLFRNGDTETRLPLKLLVAASNELPAQGEGLEALWDRFIIRIECSNIKHDKNFNAMLLDSTADGEVNVSAGLQISNEEYRDWGEAIGRIGIPEEVLRNINIIRKALTNVPITQTDERHNVYVSDRRWKKIVKLLRTSAFIHDRSEVTQADLLPIYHCLWQEPEEAEGIRDIVIRALYQEFTLELGKLRRALDTDIRVSRQHRATNKARQNLQLFDANKKIYDSYYYHILDHDTGNTFIPITDYQGMRHASRENAGQAGVLYKDPRDPKRTIVRGFDGTSPKDSTSVYLTRGEDCIYINGVRFFIETLLPGEKQALPAKRGAMSGRDYYQELEAMCSAIRQRTDNVTDNILLSEQDQKEVADFVQNLLVEIAHTRQDLEKLDD